jgi:hypothetical protein
MELAIQFISNFSAALVMIGMLAATHRSSIPAINTIYMYKPAGSHRY